MLTYAVVGMAMAYFAMPALEAIQTASYLRIAFVTLGMAGIYVLAGGILCSAFVNQLRLWPPPGIDIQINGARFLRTWPWSAARILVQLITHEQWKGRSVR